MSKRSEIERVFLLVEKLMLFGQDYDVAKSLLQELYKELKGGEPPAMDVLLDEVKGWLPPFIERKIRGFWVKGAKWWVWHYVQVREDNFKDTLGGELSMLNIYYVRYGDAANTFYKDPTPANEARFLDARMRLLGHIAKRKKWNIWRWKYEDAEYNLDECVKLGNAISRCNEGLMLWLIRYYEHSNERFMNQMKMLDSGDNSETLFKNGEGWTSVLFDIAKEQVFGDMSKVSMVPVHTIFAYLYTNKVKMDSEKSKMT